MKGLPSPAAGCSVTGDSVGYLVAAPLHSGLRGWSVMIHSAVGGRSSSLVTVIIHSAVGDKLSCLVATALVRFVTGASKNNLADDVVRFSNFCADTKQTQ